MIEDFQNQLEAYAFPGSVEKTREYLRKFWLPRQEYLFKWESIQTLLFSANKFPEVVFNPDYELLACKGGFVFVQQEFELLKECIESTKDSHILIVEDYNEADPPHESGPLLRFKYPANLMWDEINLGEGISYELFQRPVRNYYVFGDSGRWGKYVANDFDVPIDIYCFKNEYESFFREKFKVTEEEIKELKALIPKYF